MAEGPNIGTAYLRIAPDTSGLNAQMVGLFKSSKWSGLGKVAGAGLAAGLVAGGALKALYDIGAAFDEVEDNIRVKTGASGKHLEKLTNAAAKVGKTVPVDFAAAGDAVAGLNQRLGLTGKPLTQLSRQIAQLSKITGTEVQTNVQSITRLFGDWSVKTNQQRETLDKLFRTSQATGIEITTLSDSMVQFGSPLRQLGLDFDTASAMFARFEKEGVNVQTLMPGLRMALKNFSQPTDDLAKSFKQLGIDLKDGPSAALREVFEALEDAPSDLKANALAFEVFGARAGPDMAAAVREGRFELDELIKTVRDGDGTIGKAERKTRDFDEQWLLFKNNLMTQVQPAAEKVFNAVGDSMKDVTKIISDPKLTSGEKLTKLTDLVMDAVTAMAEGVGQRAPRIAEALVKGIIEAPVLSKLVIGTWLFARFGGKAAVGAAGTAVGKLVGTKLGTGLVVGFAIAFPLLIVEAYKLGQRIGEALKKAIPSISEILSDTAGNRDLTPGELLRSGAGVDQLIQAYRDMGLTAQEATERAGKAWQKYYVVSRRDGKGIERAAKGVGDEILDQSKKSGGALRDLGDTADSSGKRTQRSFKATDGASARMKEGVGTNVAGLAAQVKAGLQNIGDNTNKILTSFGVKKLTFSLADAIADGADQKKQLGGVIVPGQGDGDKVPALLEPGEVVLNKKAVAKLGGAQKANAINKLIPRFATGGIVPIPGEPGESIHASILQDVLRLRQQYKLDITDGYSTDPVHSANGEHPLGLAIDAVPGAGGSWALVDRLAQWAEPVQNQPIHPFRWVGYNGDPNHGTGNHIHLSWLAGETLGGGPLPDGGMSASIKKVLLQGPAGLLKDVGQAALDKAYRAATEYVDSKIQVGAGAESAGAPGPSIKSLPKSLQQYNHIWPNNPPGDAAAWAALPSMPFNKIAELAEWAGLPGITMAQITKGESGGKPGSLEIGASGPGGSRGVGMWAITPPYADGLPYAGGRASGDYQPDMFNPVLNAQVAKGMAPNGPNAGIWHGSDAVTGWDLHYTGPMLAKGGIVQRLAEGGIAGIPTLGIAPAFSERIGDLYQHLLGADSRKEREEIEGRIAKLLQRRNKALKRVSKHELKRIKEEGALSGWRKRIGERQRTVDIISDDIASVQTSHGLTSPRDIEALLAAQGLDPDIELSTLTPDQRAALEAMADSDYGIEAAENADEISRTTQLLDALLALRESLLAAIAEAEERAALAERAAKQAAANQKRAEDQAKAIKDDIDQLTKRLRKVREEEPPKRGKNEKKDAFDKRLKTWERERRNRMQDLGIKLDSKRADFAGFSALAEGYGGQVAAQMAAKVALGDFRGETMSSLEGVQGIGRTMERGIGAGALVAGMVPVFGGDILDAQRSLAELGANVFVRPKVDYGDPEPSDPDNPSGMSISELLEFVQAIRYGVFDDNLGLPKFHTGGIYRAPQPGGEGQAVLRDREGIFTPEQMAAMGGGQGGGEFELTITNWDEGKGYIRRVSDDRIGESNRSAMAAFGAGERR